MLPVSAAALTGSIALASVDIVNIVAIEIVVVVDRYVTAAVPIAIAPATSPSCAHCNAHSESERSVTRRINVWVRIRRRAIDHGWIVLWNVNNLRIGWLDNDYLFSSFNGLRFDCLLRGRLQISGAFRLSAHALNRVHHISLLRQKRVAQVHRPGDVLA